MLDVKVDEAKGTMTIVLSMNAQPAPSASGKTLVVASTHGNQTVPAKIGDQNITIGVNAYIKR